MTRWPLNIETAAFLTIDVQRAFLEEESPVGCPEFAARLPTLNDLSAGFRRLDVPVIHVRQHNESRLADVGLLQDIRPRTDSQWEPVAGRPGADFAIGLDVDGADYRVEKTRYSAFAPGSSSLEALMRGLDRSHIFVCGLLTDVCVATTVMSAMMLNFKVTVIEDLTTTLTEHRQQAAVEVLRQHFADVVVSEDVRNVLGTVAV